MRESGTRYGVGELVVWGVGLVVVVAVAVGLVAFGYELGKRSRFSVASGGPTATPTSTVPAGVFTPAPTSGAADPTAVPTTTPLPMGSPTDTPAPTTSAASAMVVVDAEGTDVVNVRSGPGTNFSLVGQLDVGAQAPVTGRYADWWQIEYGGGSAWIYDGIVTASNVGSVPQVVPPASPVPVQPTMPPQPTQPPPTQAPTDVRGLIARSFSVEGAPGPYGVGGDIWFNFTVANTTSSEVGYTALGVVVDETGQYQKSWSYSEFTPNFVLTHHDHLNIPAAGSYTLYLAICFLDGQCSRLMGPIVVTVQ